MHLMYSRKRPPEQYGGEEITISTDIIVEEGEDPSAVFHAAAVDIRNTAHRVLGIPPVPPSKTFLPGEVTVDIKSVADTPVGSTGITHTITPFAGITPTAENMRPGAIIPEEPKAFDKPKRFTLAAARREIDAMVDAGVLDEARLAVMAAKWDEISDDIGDARAQVDGAAVAQEVESGAADVVVTPQVLMTKSAAVSQALGEGGAAAVRALFPKFSDPDGLPATRLGEIPESRRAAFIAAAEALISG